MLALARPEVHDRFPGLFAERGAQELRLGPLTPSASERLVRAALGAAADDAVVQRIVARAEGNAFYIEELVRAVAEGAGEALPDTVLGMVQARLDALGPSRSASSARPASSGRSSGGAASRRCSASAPETLDEPPRPAGRRWRSCARRSAASFPGEVEYAFRHALVREAAYAMLSDADRAWATASPGACLERAGERDPAVLAQHFERGDDPAAAARHYQRAAEKALAGNDFAAAIDHAERALACGAEGEQRGRAASSRPRRSAGAGSWPRPRSTPPRPPTCSLAGRRPGSTPCASAICGQRPARPRRPGARSGRERRCPPRPPPAPSEPSSPRWCRWCCRCCTRARATPPRRSSRRSIGSWRARGAVDPAVIPRVQVARALRADLAGDSEEALARHRAALAAYEEGGERRAACTTLCSLGYIHASIGAFTEAEDALRTRARQRAERMGLGSVVALALHNLGGVLHVLGRIDEARAVEEQAVTAFERAKDPRLEGASRVYLSRILLTAGDAGGAEAEARRAAEAAASPAAHGAGALSALATALLEAGRVAGGARRRLGGPEVVASLGAVEDFETFIGLAHAGRCFAAGDRPAARAAVADVRRRVLDRAARLGERARARFLEAVPDNARALALAAALETEG